MSITAIIPAAGLGKRFGGNVKKQFYEILDKTVLYYTLNALNRSYPFNEFIIGSSSDDFLFMYEELKNAGIASYQLVAGGAERYETVYNCVKAAKTDYVLIHDAVRPFVTPDIVADTIHKAYESGAAICAVPVRDTLKFIKNDGVEKTVDRKDFILSHTPQVFKTSLLKKALENAYERQINVTDEAQAMELFGVEVKWVPSSADNIKITYLDDMGMAESLIRRYFS